ncbi:recombinase family protein [Microbacterium sp.]|uniref:recombinase family protein n=1 Tax=Microbacterium sp. TaxID=51671 RepID=UPI003C22EA55
MTRTVGYARELLSVEVAREDAAALRRAGASRVYIDRRDAATGRRNEFERCLSSLGKGDTLLVASAVSLSPSVEHFITTIAQLRARGIKVRSLAEPALSTVPDTIANPGDVLDALDAMRRRLIGLRTREGLDAAIAAGRRPGRPRVMTEERIEIARELRAQKRSFAQIGRALGVSESAVRRALNPATAQVKNE